MAWYLSYHVYGVVLYVWRGISAITSTLISNFNLHVSTHYYVYNLAC